VFPESVEVPVKWDQAPVAADSGPVGGVAASSTSSAGGAGGAVQTSTTSNVVSQQVPAATSTSRILQWTTSNGAAAGQYTGQPAPPRPSTGGGLGTCDTQRELRLRAWECPGRMRCVEEQAEICLCGTYTLTQLEWVGISPACGGKCVMLPNNAPACA
jgi:hypothetical protein